MLIHRITRTIATVAIIAPLIGVGVATSAQAVGLTQSVAWTNTTITNGGTTSLVYTMGGAPAYVATFYDGVFDSCFSHNATNQTLPVTYDQVRANSGYATTWWIGMFTNDCRTGPAPLMSDAFSSSELTMTPAGPYGPDTITAGATTDDSITLEWPADSWAEGYRIYQDGVLIDTVTAADLSFLVSGLTAGTSYEFTVVGYNYDFEGQGTSVTLTTTSPELASTGLDQSALGALSALALMALVSGGAMVWSRRSV